jgi:hypothetical protein
VLREHDEVRERRRQAIHPARVKPELVATQPNQCWSWDITKLLGPAKWTYYYLYVILDIYSRYVRLVGHAIERDQHPPCAQPFPQQLTPVVRVPGQLLVDWNAERAEELGHHGLVDRFGARPGHEDTAREMVTCLMCEPCREGCFPTPPGP